MISDSKQFEMCPAKLVCVDWEDRKGSSSPSAPPSHNDMDGTIRYTAYQVMGCLTEREDSIYIPLSDRGFDVETEYV
jgi:hypothetical protein